MRFVTFESSLALLHFLSRWEMKVICILPLGNEMYFQMALNDEITSPLSRISKCCNFHESSLTHICSTLESRRRQKKYCSISAITYIKIGNFWMIKFFDDFCLK